ncbi:transposase, partial [Streptobacillus felis]|uniref:transposase n=1 Tax=Streptobacillus felis TaxID=1384509 RepID=UPI00082BA773
LEKVLDKERKYLEQLKILGDRNSYSKTDIYATFMRSKKDYMKNGQLIPAYNVQIAVNSNYILDFKIFQNPTDYKTLPVFIEHLKSNGYDFKNVVADAGYESYENLKYLSDNGYTSYIKPQKHEVNKKRKNKNDIKNIINLTYNEETEEFLRKDGVVYKVSREYKYKGLIRTVFTAQDEEGHSFSISLEDYKLKKINRDNILSELGAKYRLNRSIQVERPFGDIKENFEFDRFRRKGIDKVELEFAMYALGFNLRKYINDKRKNRENIDLYKLKEVVA